MALQPAFVNGAIDAMNHKNQWPDTAEVLEILKPSDRFSQGFTSPHFVNRYVVEGLVRANRSYPCYNMRYVRTKPNVFCYKGAELKTVNNYGVSFMFLTKFSSCFFCFHNFKKLL